MEIISELESSSSPRIRKAAEKISKQNILGNGKYLENALKEQIKNPKAWQTQSAIIRALGKTCCHEILPYLKELSMLEFSATKLYCDLGFSIFLLEKEESKKLAFLYSAIETSNPMLVSGVCSAILYTEFVPNNEDIEKIIKGISQFRENEAQIISPRTYIALVAYCWPESIVKPFLESCKDSSIALLVEIAESSLERKKSSYVLV